MSKEWQDLADEIRKLKQERDEAIRERDWLKSALVLADVRINRMLVEKGLVKC